MATYGVDLTTLVNADSDTAETNWTELASPYNAGGPPADDDENLIQGTNCQSQTTSTKSGLVFSIVWDNTSGVTWTSGEVFLIWSFYAVRSNLDTIANGGLRAVIGSDLSNADAYTVGGSDDPYASGWKNVAVDPEKGHDFIISSGSGTTYRVIGIMPKTLAAISKGTPHAVDAIRYGRGEIYCTGTGCEFTTMAEYNDYNSSSAHPNSAGSPSDGYNRFGLFEKLKKNTFLSKGLLSFGQSGTSVTFSDSNKTILIDDTLAVTSSFNKVEINHASSSVTLTNITFTSLGTTSKGAFEMIANATFTMTGGGFNDFDTFIFDTNATLTRVTFNGCGQITHSGADFEACVFQGYEGTAGTAYMLYAETTDPDGELDNCSFTKGTAATHAIQFDATNTPTTITLRGIDFSGYNASNGNNDSALYFPSTSKSYTVNLVGCTGDISYRVGSGGSVTLVPDPVTVTLTGIVSNSELTIVSRGTAVDTGSDGASTANSRNFVTTNTWTVDAYRGHLLEITSGADAGRYYCYGNSATTLYLDTELSATASSLTWALYDENDDTIDLHVENTSGDEDWVYSTGAGSKVDIMINNVSYQDYVLPNYVKPSASTSLPISQIKDVNYYNP